MSKIDQNKTKKSKTNKSCWSYGQVGQRNKECSNKKAKISVVVAQTNIVLGLERNFFVAFIH